MALVAHDIFGQLYYEVDKFRLGAAAFGVKAAVAAMSDDEIETLIALASRSVDAYAAASGFTPNAEITENHKFDVKTRRVFVNNPPVVELTAFQLRVGPQQLATIAVTPISKDPGDNNVGFGSIFYNRQERYLELSSWSVVVGVTPAVISLGLMEVQAEIKYRNRPTGADGVDPLIAAATAYQSAYLVGAARVDNAIAPGIASMSTPEVSMTRSAGGAFGRTGNGASDGLHPMVAQLLASRKQVVIA